MNKERRDLVTMTRDVVRAIHGEQLYRPIARVVEARLDSLISAEKRAISQMENYKHLPSSKKNYEEATAALDWLKTALDAAVYEDWEQVDHLLTHLCEPEVNNE